MLYAAAIIFFCFFYTALVFNPRETADNLKRSGAFIPGIRPGEQTSKYIDKVMTRLTLAGAAYITFVCLSSRVHDDLLECSVLFWRYIVVNHRCSCHGFYGSGSDVIDVSSV